MAVLVLTASAAWAHPHRHLQFRASAAPKLVPHSAAKVTGSPAKVMGSDVRARDVGELQATQKVTFSVPRVLPVTGYRVSDGDTINVDRWRFGTFKVTTQDGVQHPITFARDHVPIRELGEDTPELHVPDPQGHMHSQGEPAEWATTVLTGFLSKASRIELEPGLKQPIDKYGRVLGTTYAWVKNGSGAQTRIDVNREMLRVGAADLYVYYGPDFNRKQFADYSTLSKNAITNRLGIYGPHFLSERPNCYRAEVQEHAHENYLADLSTGLLYPPGHQYEQYVPIWNRVWIRPGDAAAARQKLNLKDANVPGWSEVSR
jgi:endonuclease YncB( thermonuclease family)